MQLPQAALRSQRISQVVSTIKKAHSQNIFPDYKKFVYLICEEFFVSELKAKEYLRIAMTSSKTIKDKYNFIVPLGEENKKIEDIVIDKNPEISKEFDDILKDGSGTISEGN